MCFWTPNKPIWPDCFSLLISLQFGESLRHHEITKNEDIMHDVSFFIVFAENRKMMKKEVNH